MTSTQLRRLLLLAFALLPLLTAPPQSALAQDDAYTATVTVDATSDNVAKARDMARVDGAKRALNTVIAKLAGGPDKVKPLKLSDDQVTDMVASFEVANEKMSAVRYVADYTYHFKQAAVDKVMQSAGIAINSDTNANASANSGQAAGGKPIVVLPIYQNGDTAELWDDPNPWREAWAQRPASTSGPAFMVPLGDVSDLAVIDAEKARTGDSKALAGIAKKEGADDVLVMIATERTGGDKSSVDVTARRYHLGQFVDVHSDSIDAKPNEADADLFRRAADTIVADIGNGWKNAKGGLSDQQGSVVVVIPITGLDDWIKLRDRVATVSSVRKLDLKSLSRQEATVEIQYVGSMDQLKANLAAIKLDLQGGDPIWRLARSAADKP
jgi:hypothetical protein